MASLCDDWPGIETLSAEIYSNVLVFIDESGDAGMKDRPGSSRYFFVAAVLFEDNDAAWACDKRIDSLRQEMGLDSRFEFHFNSCSREFRKEFLRAVGQFHFFYHVFGLNKRKLWGQGFLDKHSFYKYTTGLVFENAKSHLHNAKVVIDRTGNQEFRGQLGKYLKRKMNEPGSDQLIRRVSMEASHSNNLLQVADMVCGAVARSYSDERKDTWIYREIIRHRERRVQVWPK